MHLTDPSLSACGLRVLSRQACLISRHIQYCRERRHAEKKYRV